jgi:hypothetical protein
MKTAGELRPGDVWLHYPNKNRTRPPLAYLVTAIQPGLARSTVRVIAKRLPDGRPRSMDLFRENQVEVQSRLYLHLVVGAMSNAGRPEGEGRKRRPRRATRADGSGDSITARRARNLAIVERVKAGDPLCAVARAFGLTRQNIWSICHRAGVETPRRPRQRDATKVQRDREIVERVRAGDSLVAVARAFGLTHVRVLVICERDGVRSRYRSLMVERRTQRAAIGPPDDWRVK